MDEKEFIKKIRSLGVSGSFVKEETLKKLFSELPLAKETMNTLLSQTDQIKKRLNELVKDEFKKQIQKINFTYILEELMKDNDVEMKATFTLRPKNKKKRNG
jgi:predicted transcriptional regulator